MVVLYSRLVLMMLAGWLLVLIVCRV